MNTIGINHDMFISSAALVVDGEITAAAPEERFTRNKRSRAFPKNSIEFCLKEAGLTIDDVDCFVSSWNPGVYMQKFNPLVSSQRRSKTEYLYSVPDNIMSLFPGEEQKVDCITQTLETANSHKEVHYITHHRAHAATAFYLSPFEEAAFFTADQQGEFESTTWGIGRGTEIDLLGSIDFPHSIGSLYGAVTEFLGYRQNGDEWRVMALASIAQEETKYYKLFKNRLYTLHDDGTFELDLSYLKAFDLEKPNLYTSKLEQLIGLPRSSDEPLDDRHHAIAAGLQRATEEILTHALRHLHVRTRLTNLCVSGGCFMNSVYNGKILEETPFEKVHIPPFPDDSGNSIGCALYHQHQRNGIRRANHTFHNYFGPQFSDTEIESVIKRFGITAKRVEDPAAACAALICDELVVGWFQGRMEFGQRALGNRSILADPRDETSKTRVNKAVKFRESYRPFAPAVLEEKAIDWFELGAETSIPYMEKVRPIKPERRSLIPAVTHFDGSGRLQTVSKKTNPPFYRLIAAFEERTGVPIVLNTSFNQNGEPIVCSPEDAIRSFFTCGLDALVIGSFLVTKR